MKANTFFVNLIIDFRTVKNNQLLTIIEKTKHTYSKIFFQFIPSHIFCGDVYIAYAIFVAVH